jgi:hypothetical protein
MSLHQYLIAILLIIVCSGTTASENNTQRIEFQYFSFSIPNTEIWNLVEKTNSQAVFTTRHGKANYRITFMENYTRDPFLITLPAKEAADAYRNHEKFGMMEFGVKRGLYELHDLTMGEEQIVNKTFYTMKYTTINPQAFQSARLYLYYPFEKENNYFFVAHYSEAAPSRDSLKRSFEADFLRTLKTVSYDSGE